MRRTTLAAALLALMVPAMGHADDADDKKQVEMLMKQNVDALVAGDTKSLDAILAEDWVIIGPFGDIQSRDGQAKDLKDGTMKYLALDESEVKVRVYRDAAVGTSRAQARLKFRGQDMQVPPVRASNVFIKQGGKWRCVSTQLTQITSPPADNR